MRRHNYRAVGLALAICMVGAWPLSAQQAPGAVKHRNDCRLAEQVLTHGQPANNRAWALRVISNCGPLGGEAVATLLHDYKYATERTQEYEEIVLLATRLTDRSIYEAAMELSRDPEATNLARIQSIRPFTIR